MSRRRARPAFTNATCIGKPSRHARRQLSAPGKDHYNRRHLAEELHAAAVRLLRQHLAGPSRRLDRALIATPGIRLLLPCWTPAVSGCTPPFAAGDPGHRRSYLATTGLNTTTVAGSVEAMMGVAIAPLRGWLPGSSRTPGATADSCSLPAGSLATTALQNPGPARVWYMAEGAVGGPRPRRRGAAQDLSFLRRVRPPATSAWRT